MTGIPTIPFVGTSTGTRYRRRFPVLSVRFLKFSADRDAGPRAHPENRNVGGGVPILDDRCERASGSGYRGAVQGESGAGRSARRSSGLRAAGSCSARITNAIRHGGVGVSAPIQLVVERTDPFVTVSVTQPGPVPDRPVVNMPDPWSTSGYGLGIVDAVADRWGVQLDPPSVWFEISL